MKIRFFGAAGTVTGSCCMVETSAARFAVDCGLHQGNAAIEARNLDTELYNPRRTDFFLITHAHMDHAGLLPCMAREGFKGPIYCTAPTKDLLAVMLLDSAHIQEMEAEWKSRKQKRKGGGKAVEPLYTRKDAAQAVGMLHAVAGNTCFEPAPGIQVTYRDAGHILGAAILELIVAGPDSTTRLVFSGDLGRPAALIVNDPDIPAIRADYLFLESTYGDRNHKNETASLDELAEAIAFSCGHNEKVIIPAFAVERTQEILHALFLLHKQGRLPDIPIFVDSPLAIAATEIFRKHPNFYDKSIQDFLKNGEDPFTLPKLRYTPTPQESQGINNVTGSAIVISASGMCNAGRIKHHLRHTLWKPGTSVVFVGYQAAGTPGRKIVDGADVLRLFGEEVAVRAKIFTVGGFSGHAGQSQIVDWVGKFVHKDMAIILVHGETKAQTALAELLRENFGITSIIPGYLEEMTLAPGKKPPVRMDVKQSVPGIDWDMLVCDTEAKVSHLRRHLPVLSSHDWAAQAELRDKLLEINTELLRLMSSQPQP